MRKLKRFNRDETGATAVEYAVMLGLVLLASIIAIGAFGGSTANSLNNTSNELAGALGP